MSLYKTFTVDHSESSPFLQVKMGNPMWNPLHEYYTYMKMTDTGVQAYENKSLTSHPRRPQPVMTHNDKSIRRIQPTAHPIRPIQPKPLPTAHPIPHPNDHPMTMNEGYSFYPMYTHHNIDHIDRMATEQPVYVLQHPHRYNNREYHNRFTPGYPAKPKQIYELPAGNIYKSIPL
jgi:hypothetical protein